MNEPITAPGKMTISQIGRIYLNELGGWTIEGWHLEMPDSYGPMIGPGQFGGWTFQELMAIAAPAAEVGTPPVAAGEENHE